MIIKQLIKPFGELLKILCQTCSLLNKTIFNDDIYNNLYIKLLYVILANVYFFCLYY